MQQFFTLHIGNLFEDSGFYLGFFLWGGESILKNIFEPRGGEKTDFFRPSRGSGGMLPRKILMLKI